MSVSWHHRLLVLLTFCLPFGALAQSTHEAPAPAPATSTGSSITDLLNPDGTLRPGTSGSFNPTGYRMMKGVNGAPVFRPAGAGDEHWRDEFTLPGTNGVVNAMAVAANGDVYIGGYFTVVGNAVVANVACWNGTEWSALGAGVDDWVTALAISGTDVYAGGTFMRAGGAPASRIAKWDGSAWSTLGSGLNAKVYALGVSGSVVYAGGAFTSVGDGSRVTAYFGVYDPSYVSPVGLSAEAAPPTSLTVYPNPAPTTGQVQVQTNQPGSALRLFDPLGRLVGHYSTDATGAARLDVRGLAPGLYIVRAGATSQRLVVE